MSFYFFSALKFIFRSSVTSEKFEKPKRNFTDEVERIALSSIPSSKDKVSYSDKTSASTLFFLKIFYVRVFITCDS